MTQIFYDPEKDKELWETTTEEERIVFEGLNRLIKKGIIKVGAGDFYIHWDNLHGTGELVFNKNDKGEIINGRGEIYKK